MKNDTLRKNGSQLASGLLMEKRVSLCRGWICELLGSLDTQNICNFIS